MVDRLVANSPTCLPATHLLTHKSGVEWRRCILLHSTKLFTPSFSSFISHSSFSFSSYISYISYSSFSSFIPITFLSQISFPISHEQSEKMEGVARGGEVLHSNNLFAPPPLNKRPTPLFLTLKSELCFLSVLRS